MPNVHLDPALTSDPLALLELVRALVDGGEGDRALALVEAALAARPEDPALKALKHLTQTRRVVRYHQSMLADRPRNRAYARAIEEAGLKGKSVLEIGSGSGILAMMAARAGADQIVTCEADPVVAESARSIIELNGYSDRIRLVVGTSTSLSVEELGGKPDYIISELFDSDLLGEGLLASIRDAHARLAHGQTVFVPPIARVIVSLADFDRRDCDLSDVEGFDLRPMRSHRQRRSFMRSGKKFQLRSDPLTAFELNLGDIATLSPRIERHSLESSGGSVVGLLQWIEIDFGKGIIYSNAPGEAPDSHWDPYLYEFEDPIETARGQSVPLSCMIAEDRLLFWPE